MYCPRCATQLAEATTHCPGCDFDVRPLAQFLRQDAERSPSAEQRASGITRAWRRQRHALGLLLLLCSLLVGCFIPISLGLFNGFIGLSALITALAGVAGVLLLLGIMLLLAAEGTILTSRPATNPEVPTRAESEPPHPLLEERPTVSGATHDNPVAHSARR
jgi:hypothetical protein